MKDPIQELKYLAGLTEEDRRPGINRDGGLSPIGSNISLTGMEKRRLEKEHNIQPGTDEWFQLWFSRPYLTGEPPVGKRSKKN